MGITTGHVFSDGDTVTSAKLNAMVNDATISADTISSTMIKDDAIETRHIADGSITSNQLAGDSVSLNAISSATSAAGTIIQSGAGGSWEELSPGNVGTVLMSGGADTLATFSTIGASSLGAGLVSDLTQHTTVLSADLLLVKDSAAGVNKHATVQDMLESVDSLGTMDDSDIATDDKVFIYDKDATAGKGMQFTELAKASLATVSSLNALTQSTVADNDSLLVYDTSASEVKKISKAELGTGGSMLQVTVPITVANNGSSVTHTITSTPSSNDSGVLVIYDVNVSDGNYHAGSVTVTLPDAGPYLNEGIKKLQITMGHQRGAGGSFVIESTDSDSNTVFNASTAPTPLERGVIVTCTPFVYDGNHYWTVSG
jgi:hypothetical protein